MAGNKKETRYYPVRNLEDDAVPPFGLMRVTNISNDGFAHVRKPSAEGQSDNILVNGPNFIPSGGEGEGHDFFPAIVAYSEDATGSGGGSFTPAAGQVWGTRADSWYLHAASSGFKILGGGGEGLVNVKPSSPSSNSSADEEDELPHYRYHCSPEGNYEEFVLSFDETGEVVETFVRVVACCNDDCAEGSGSGCVPSGCDANDLASTLCLEMDVVGHGIKRWTLTKGVTAPPGSGLCSVDNLDPACWWGRKNAILGSIGPPGDVDATLCTQYGNGDTECGSWALNIKWRGLGDPFCAGGGCNPTLTCSPEVLTCGPGHVGSVAWNSITITEGACDGDDPPGSGSDETDGGLTACCEDYPIPHQLTATMFGGTGPLGAALPDSVVLTYEGDGATWSGTSGIFSFTLKCLTTTEPETGETINQWHFIITGSGACAGTIVPGVAESWACNPLEILYTDLESVTGCVGLVSVLITE